MAAPSLQKTWEFDINNTSSGASGTAMRQQLMLDIKNAFISAVSFTNPWAVDSSCDGVTAGTAADGVDRWSDVGDIVWETAGARSWIVLRQDDYFSDNDELYMCIELDQGASTDYNAAIGVYVSKGTNFTSGTTTARPTSADEVELLPSGGSEVTANWQGSDLTSETSKRWHMMASSDGKEWRLFFAVNGVVVAIWMIGAPNNPPSGWDTPIWSIIYGEDTTSSNVTDEGLTSSLKLYVLCTDGVLGDFACSFTMPSMYSNSLLRGGEALNNTFDSSRYIAPSGLYSPSGAAVGFMGYVNDVFWSKEADAVGTTYASQTFVNLGGLVLPWDGSSAPQLS